MEGDPPTAPDAERDDAKLAGEMEQLRKSLGRLEKLTTDAPTPANAPASSAVSSSVSFSHGSASVNSHKLGSTVTWSDTPGTTAQGMTPAQGAEAVEALTEDFNDFFHSIASKYGLDTPTPADMRQPAEPQPASAAFASAAGFEFRVEHHQVAETSVEGDDTVAAAAAAAAGEDVGVASGEDSEPSPMLPQHSGQSPERPKTSRGRPSVESEVWVVEPDTSSTESPEEPDAMQQQELQQEDPTAPPPPQHMEEVGEVGLRPDGFPHGTALPSGARSSAEEQQATAHVVAGVQAWLHDGADAGYTGAEEEEGEEEEEAYCGGAHQEEDDVPLYESHDGHPNTRYTEAMDEGPDAYDLLEAMLPPDDDVTMLRSSAQIMTSGGEEPTTLLELNRMLRDNGFGDVSAGDSPARPADLLKRLSEVLCQYERRSTMVQELLAGTEMARQREERTAAQIRRLRAERDAAQKEANAALLKAEALSAKQEMAAKAAMEAAKRAATTECRAAAAHKSATLQLSQAKRDAEKALRRSDELYSRTLQPPPPEETELRAMASSRDALKGEVSQLEHQLRVKAQEVSRLQERLDDAYDKAAHDVSPEELELRRSQLARDQLERKVSQLEHAARAKAQEMSRLQEKLDELYVRSVQDPSVEEIELKRLVLARDQLNQKVSQLEHTVRAKDKEQQRLQEQLEELYVKSTQSSLDEAEMRKAMSARDTLGNKVSQLEHACRAKDRQMAALHDKVQQLYERATATPSEEHMQELRRAQLARDTLHQKVTMLENLGRVKDQECLRLQDKVQEMYEKTSSALTDEQLDEMRKLQVSRSQLSAKVSQLEHAERVKDQEVERLTTKVQELYERTSGGATSEEAAEETRQLQLSRSQLSAQVSQLEHAGRVKDQDVARLKAKVQELYQKGTAVPTEEAAAELRQALLARDHLKREVSQLEHAARAKDQDMARLQDKVQELYVRASTTSAEEQAAELRRVQRGRDQAVQRSSQLEHLGRVKDQENARLQERLEDAYVKISSGSARDEQTAELRRAVTAKEALSRELAAVEVAGRAKEQEVERLKAKVQELYEKAAAGGGAEEREEEMRRLVLLRDQLTQKVSQLEHQCRAKDTERVRLQEMLDAVYGKLGSDTEETEALKLLHGRDAMNQKVQAMLEVNLRAKEQEVSRLQDKVAELYEKVSEASSADDDGVLRKAQLSRDQLMQKVALLEHSCRAREKEIQRLKESLEDKVRREEYRTIRDKETYERLRRQVLQGPAAVQSGTKGLKSADVVALYEGKREVAERELSELRAEVKQLSGELRERDNLIAYKDHGGGWRTPDAASLMERQEEAERSAADAKRTLATLEAKAAAAQRSMQLQLSQADERNASLADENGNLILELQSRPSVKQLRDAERRAEQVQAKLSRERAGASEAAMEEKRHAKEMESKLKRSEPLLTAAQIKRDKAIHHLRLGPVARLPKDVLVDLVQDICIQLELDDVGLLESGVAKLLRVMRAVPRMERFIAEVSEVVFVDGAAHVHEHVGRDPHQVPTVLKGWLGSLGTLASLHEFRKVVVHELSKRAGGAAGVAVRDSAAPAELAVQVKQLVEMERVHLLTEANFDDTAAMLANKPDVLVNKIVSHFQSLFAAPKIDGVLAKMNQVYLQTTEQHNFMKVLRQLLGLDATAGVNSCLKRLTHLLDEEAKAFDLRTEYVMGKLDEAKVRERAVTMPAASAPEGSSDADGATDRETEQHRHITSNLRNLYDLTDSSKIVPHCEKLLERLHKLEDVLPKYQGITGQLYELLRCTSMDEIVPSVRRLTSRSGGDDTE